MTSILPNGELHGFIPKEVIQHLYYDRGILTEGCLLSNNRNGGLHKMYNIYLTNIKAKVLMGDNKVWIYYSTFLFKIFRCTCNNVLYYTYDYTSNKYTNNSHNRNCCDYYY